MDGRRPDRRGRRRGPLGGWLREARKPGQIPIVDTGRWVSAPDGSGRLPVLMSPTVDRRYGPTAVLGMPELDKTDEVIFERIGLPWTRGRWRRTRSRRGRRPPTGYRTSRSRASARLRRRSRSSTAPTAGSCRCRRSSSGAPARQHGGPSPKPAAYSRPRRGLHRLRVPQMRRRGAAQETDTMDCHMDTAWMECALAVPADERTSSTRPNCAAGCRASYIHGADTGGFILDKRRRQAMRDAGHGASSKTASPSPGSSCTAWSTSTGAR